MVINGFFAMLITGYLVMGCFPLTVLVVSVTSIVDCILLQHLELWELDKNPVGCAPPSVCNVRELKHARFWDADGNRKTTFRVLGKYCLPDFYDSSLMEKRYLAMTCDVVLWGQVKSENSSLPVTVRVSKTCLLKAPWRFAEDGKEMYRTQIYSARAQLLVCRFYLC